MSDDGALRVPGGARGVENHGRIVESDRHIAWRGFGAGEHRFVSLDAGFAFAFDDDALPNTGRVRPCPGEFSQFIVEHEQGGARVREHELDLGRCEAGVQRDEDRPERSRGEERLEKGRVIVAEVGDAITGAYASACKSFGESVDALRKSTVGDAIVPVDDGDRVTLPLGLPSDPTADAQVLHVVPL